MPENKSSFLNLNIEFTDEEKSIATVKLVTELGEYLEEKVHKEDIPVTAFLVFKRYLKDKED
jgi:hypothetical protein